MNSLLAVLVLFLGSLTSTLACMCQPQHPQDKFCQVQFVFKGKVQSKETIYADPSGAQIAGGPPGPRVASEIKYQILAKPVFRNASTTFSLHNNQVVDVMTNAQQNMCGKTTLEIGQTYLVSAMEIQGKLMLFYCGWTVPYSEVSPSQKKMLRGDYATICDQAPRCRVAMPCRDPDQSRCPQLDGCVFDMNDTCKAKHSRCQRDENQTCGWQHYNRRYNKCLQEQ